MNYWFTSDHHFGHKNILIYANRPFSSIEEHDKILIDNWNKVVKSNDIVYHLGDFCLAKDISKYLNQLNGKVINFIIGSHDKQVLDYFWGVKKIIAVSNQERINLGNMETIKIGNIEITLCHYAMLRWPKSHYGTYHLFGHSHNKLDTGINSLSFDVGVDCHNYFPINFEQVKEIMSKKEFKPFPGREKPRK